jgi:heme exporter protein C
MNNALRTALTSAFWLLTAGTVAAGAWMALAYAPTEETMGDVQRIFYLHVPSAINTFLAFAVVFVASVGYLAQRKAWWDDLANASAQVGIGLCSIVLITGMIWGKVAWGQWWTWSPRLTFSLLLWLLYIVYLIVRSSIDSEQRKRLVCATYGVVAFLDVPLVYLSAKLLPDIHPQSIALAPQMKATLGFCFIPVTLVTIGLIHFLTARAARQRSASPTTEAAASSAPMNLNLLTPPTH